MESSSKKKPRLTITVSICGRKKCFIIKRNGLFDWEYGCTDPDGNTVTC